MSLWRPRRSTVSELETQKSWRCSSSLKSSRILLVRKRYEVLGRQPGMSKVTQLARIEARMRVQAHQARNTVQCIAQGRVYWAGAQVCHRQCAPLCLCVPGGRLGPQVWECRPCLLGCQSSQGGLSLGEYAWQQILLFPNSFFPWGNPVLALCVYIILQAHSSDHYQLT